jgi:kexin
VGPLDRWWLIEWESPDTASDLVSVLTDDPRVENAQLQMETNRSKKTNDPFFSSQWHLRNTGQLSGHTAGMDLRVEPVWGTGNVGSAVTVAVVDDGLEHAHPDIQPNYSTANSFDFLSNDPDPSPLPSDDHGTACGGLIAARGENGLGVAGVAHGANLAGLRLVGSGQSDAREASALGYRPSNIHIYSNSWGPPDDGRFEAPGPLALSAIQNSVIAGRSGLGSIYTWAAGNGGTTDWSNKDGFANLPETIAVSAVNGNQFPPTYAEGGSNILVCALAGASNVTTSDLVGTSGTNNGSTQGNLSNADYTNSFDGTSAATPQVAGVIALMLDANPSLDWRSVQHILVNTSRRIRPADSGWKTNGAGLRFHHRHGAGLVDAEAATAKAAQWIGLPPRVTKTSTTDAPNVLIPDNFPNGIMRTIDFADTLYIEHVEVELRSSHTFWGDLEILLVSPSGMESQLSKSSAAPAGTGPSNGVWRFTTVHHWGEQAQGTWTLRVNDLLVSDFGNLVDWTLVFHGTDSAIGANGGVAVAGTPTVTQVQPNLVGIGSTVTVTGTGLAASPTLSVSIAGVPQTIVGSDGSSLTFTVVASTPTGSQPLTINNGIASVSTHISVVRPGGGGGGTCMLATGGQGAGFPWWAALALCAVVAAGIRRRAFSLGR